MIALFTALVLAVPPISAQAPARETIAQITIHGNDATPDAAILALAGVAVGAPFTEATTAAVAARLRDSHKFQKVEVLKRYASISDPSQIALVIVVDEGPVSIKLGDAPGARPTFTPRRGITDLMFAPILDYEDGYGFTYGVRLACRDVGGRASRVFVPLSWGGERKAGVEYEKTFDRAIVTRVSAGADLVERTNPYYGMHDTRRTLSARVEHAAGIVRLGASTGWQHVSFGGADDTLRTVGADAALDTRVDPLLPRNAVFVSGAWQHVAFDTRPGLVLSRYDARAYLGLVRQTVLVLRVVRDDASGARPDYLKPLLGGADTLRGFRAGFAAGDVLVAGTLELRVPLSSPLQIARLGVSVFTDTGTTYDHGQSFDRRRLLTDAGGSVWVTAALLQVSLSIAHGIGAGTRVVVSGGLGF
jgi:outer membrane protein assembly factor BamA